MILHLNCLLLTKTITGRPCLSVLPDTAPYPTGTYYTGNYLITAFDATGRVWISDLRSGEGLAVVAEDLEQFLFDELDLVDAGMTEVPRKKLDDLLGNYFGMRF